MAAYAWVPSASRSLRLRAVWHRWRLDRELAAGLDPHTSDEHALRAEQLVDPRRRARLARSLRRAVAGAGARRGPGVPVCRAAVLEARPALSALADDLDEMAETGATGVARVVQVLSDGAAPLPAVGAGRAAAGGRGRAARALG